VSRSAHLGYRAADVNTKRSWRPAGIREQAMTTFKSEFLTVLSERGFIHQCSDYEGLDAAAAKGPITGYIGFDATATSLHAGSLIQIMLLHWMQKTGHRPIALMGGGTSMIGDPSFREEQRKLLTVEAIEANIAGIKTVFANYLDFGAGPTDAIMANNADWLLSLNYVSFLREVGRHFSVNRMLTFDSVKTRLDREQSLSFLEFNYMILQAYDFVELNRRTGCILQMGGSDQWGNIVNGIDLGRRMDDVQLYALTSPLLTTSSGAKMGKTASGAVWLNADLMSAYDFWQFWRNTEDADVERFLKLYTTLPLGEVARLAALGGAEINEAKKVLATEATALLHGRAAAEAAAETARRTFEEGTLAESLPTIAIPRSELVAGLGLLTAVVRAGLAASNGEVRRAIANNAIRVNDAPAEDDKAVLGLADLTPEGVIKLSSGRKRHVLLRPV
jgi:tyrosyl-tRNA synthetase